MFKRLLLFSIFYIFITINVIAREYLVSPEWYIGSNDFRSAVIDEDNRLIDSYTLMNSDTVNVFSTNTGEEYHLNVNVMITNLHNEPLQKYQQYYKDANGKIKKGKPVYRPVYGWVWGMKDLQHYNAVWLRPSEANDEIYANETIEYCVVGINDSDTTYYVRWKQANFPNRAFNDSKNNLWIQYNNNTAWIGGGYNLDIPWSIVHNIPSYGNLTGLYLSAGAKVKVEDVFVIVNDKGSIEQTEWNRHTLNNYFSEKGNSIIEGFWDVTIEKRFSSNIKMGGDYRFAIVQDNDVYKLIYLDGAVVYPGKWKEGAVKAILYPADSGFFDIVWYDAECEPIDNILAFVKGNELVMSFMDDDASLILTRAKSYDIPRTNDDTKFSMGSGFALTTDGYIATNYHVVKNNKMLCAAQYINDSTLSSYYYAEVVAIDSINDLAIIKVNDPRYIPLENVPYKIAEYDLRTGENIFNASFPQAFYLNTSLKIYTGIVTSLSGETNSTYMTSLEIDQGSSGSPVFDEKGNIVGVVRSITSNKYTRIHASYVIKNEFLINLMKSIGLECDNDGYIETELSLPERVEAITPCIYIIYNFL